MYHTVGIMLVALVSHGAVFSFAGIGMVRVAPLEPEHDDRSWKEGGSHLGGTRFSGLCTLCLGTEAAGVSVPPSL